MVVENVNMLFQSEIWITEDQAYERHRLILGDKDLRRARRAGMIGFIRRRRRYLYKLDDLDTFVSQIVAREYTPATVNLAMSKPAKVPNSLGNSAPLGRRKPRA